MDRNGGSVSPEYTFDKTDFSYKGLHWSSGHIDWYKNIAGIIMAHNIWFCTEEKDQAFYKSFDLNDLIIINNLGKRLKKNDNELLFLLCLADTIEPTKHFCQLQPLCVFDKLKIDYDHSKQEIVIEIADDCLDYSGWFKKIKSLGRWMTVEVKQSANLITIKIGE